MRYRFRRSIEVVALLVAVFLSVGAVQVDSSKDEAKAEPVELIDERTASSKTFANPDGSLTKSLFGSPVHFQDEADESWDEISNALVATLGEGGQVWTNEANSFDVSFNSDADGEFVTIEVGGEQVGLSLEGASGGLAVADGSQITYLGAKASVKLEYEVLSTGVKETIVLQNSEAPDHYRFFLSLDPTGVRVTRYPDGSVAFTPPGFAAPAFVLAAPFVLEGGEPAPGVARMSVSRAKGRFAVDLLIDPEWLSSGKRTFPIELDPTISIQTGTTDVSFGCSPCSGNGSGSILPVGTSTSAAWRAAIKFDLGDLPPLNEVAGASLNLYFLGSCIDDPPECGSHTLDAHLLQSAWSAGSTSLSYGSALPSSPTLDTSEGPQWATWTVTSAVNDWVLDESPDPNYGFLVKRSSETLEESGPEFASSRFAEPTLAPRLDVTYASDGVELYVPARVHSSGADLAWSHYVEESVDPEAPNFIEYQVHRSLTPHFEPSADTLIGRVGDVDVTGYTDTSAAPETDFFYRIVVSHLDEAEAVEVSSNERTIETPADGLARIEVQPDPEAGKATYLSSVSETNAGEGEELFVGHPHGYSLGEVVSFDTDYWFAVEDDPLGEPGLDEAWGALRSVGPVQRPHVRKRQRHDLQPARGRLFGRQSALRRLGGDLPRGVGRGGRLGRRLAGAGRVRRDPS